MLQPMQPMGTPNQAATGPQTPKPQMPGMPQQGKPQGTPAGALIGMMPQGGIMAPIDKVANAYQGNPQALEQKAAGNDLLAALAKQRLDAKLAEEERILKLKQAAQQGQQKTVIQQLDDRLLQREMDSLTKNEMQDEQVDTLKQKQAQQQQGQQRLMQAAMNPQAGLPGLPAPNAAEPRAMATGGIVAFQGGGKTTVDPVTGEVYTEEERTGLGDWFSAQAAKARGFSPEAAEAIKVNPDVQAYVDKYGQQLLSSPDLPQFQRDPRGYVQAKQAEAARPVTQPQAQAVPDTQATPTPTPDKGAGQNAANLNRPAPIRNIAAVPGGGIAGEGRNAVLEKAMVESMKQDPRAEAEASRDSAYKFLQPDEADMKARREGLASLQALNAAENDPDRQWTRRVLRALPSKGTSFMANTMGALGEGALAARDEEYARQLQGIGNEQRVLKGIMEDVYKPKKEATDVGSKTEQFASSEKTHAMTAASHIRSAEIQAAVQAASHQAAALERQLVRETNDRNYNFNLYEKGLKDLTTEMRKADEIYQKGVQNMGIVGTKPNKEQQEMLLSLKRDRETAQNALQKMYAPLIEQAAIKAGVDKGLATLGTKAAGGFTLESVTK